MRSQESIVTTTVKIVVERHPDGYVAYPLGIEGVVVGEGDTFDEAVADATSALAFHIETFGQSALNAESPVLEAFVVEAALAV
jgi:predicted RNase H-like HicB family nuclease